MTYSANVTTLAAGQAAGDDLTLKGYDTYPKITLLGGTSLYLYCTTAYTIRMYSSATNFLNFDLSGSDARLTAPGTNYNISLVPNGTGLVKFGTYTATPGTITGYITMLDSAGNSRKIAVTT